MKRKKDKIYKYEKRKDNTFRKYSMQAWEKYTESKALQIGYDLIDYLKKPVNIEIIGSEKRPYFLKELNVYYNKFLSERGLSHDVLRRLKLKFPSFKRLLSIADNLQESKLVEYGLNSLANATMAKFVLINKHGWTERIEHSMSKETELLNTYSDTNNLNILKREVEKKVEANGFHSNEGMEPLLPEFIEP